MHKTTIARLAAVLVLAMPLAACDALQPLNEDNIIARSIEQEPWMAPLYEVFEREFPEEFAEYKRLMLAQAQSGRSEVENFEFGRNFMLQFMADNAQHFSSAPDAELFATRDATLRVIEMLAEEETRYCANFTMTGLQAYDQPSRPAMNLLGQATAAQLRAVAAGKRNPVARELADEADFIAFADALEAEGMTTAEVDDMLGGGNGLMYNGPEYQCRAGLAIHRALVRVPDDTSARLSAMLLNPAG